MHLCLGIIKIVVEVMKKFRLILVNFLLLFFITFLSFASLYVYQTMPEIRKLMDSVDKNMSVEYLVRQSFMAFIILFLAVYSFYLIIFYLLLKHKPTLKRILITVVIILGLVVVDLLLDTKKTNLPNAIGAFASTLVFGSVGLGARALIEYFNEKDQKKELEKKNLQSELGLLRSQINPHFLFNTLNNIDALIRKDPGRASEILIKLSVQMRYMLYDSNTDKISLVSELEFIKDYMILQRLRIKNDHAVLLRVSGKPDGIEISPMLFISFIENAFKHCTDKEQDGAIQIDISIEDAKKLIFMARNIYNPENVINKDATGGIGLDLVKRRLDLLYAGKYELDVNQENNLYSVNLKIHLNDN
jgi:sensor histidine kinase YesM